jgi:hypothetical protein
MLVQSVLGCQTHGAGPGESALKCIVMYGRRQTQCVAKPVLCKVPWQQPINNTWLTWRVLRSLGGGSYLGLLRGFCVLCLSGCLGLLLQSSSCSYTSSGSSYTHLTS